MRLERSEMLDVEGGSWDECLRIMRHECGPAVQHAWRLHRRPSWRRHFGNSTRGIVHTRADVEPALEQRIARTSRRIYRVLQLDGYARIDYRLSPEGELYFLEANPDPEIASSQEFAAAAEEAGLPYPDLLLTIVQLGLARARA